MPIKERSLGLTIPFAFLCLILVCGPVDARHGGQNPNTSPEFIPAITAVSRSTDPGGQSVKRIFTLTQTDTMSEVTSTLRTVVNGQQLSFDQAHQTVTVQANAREAGLAEWLCQELDNRHPSPGGQEYIMPDNSDDRTVVLRYVRMGAPTAVEAAHNATSQDLQEIVNAIRVLGDVPAAAALVSRNTLVWRGNAGQTDFALWLLEQLATPPASDWGDPISYQLKLANPGALRIFYFPPATTIQNLGRIADMIRSQARIERVVALTGVRAIALRGTDHEVEVAEQIVAEHR